MPNTAEFDASLKTSHGYWYCSECDIAFFEGGPPIHKSNCSRSGKYDNLTYRYSTQEKEKLEKGIQPGLAPHWLLQVYQAQNPT